MRLSIPDRILSNVNNKEEIKETGTNEIGMDIDYLYSIRENGLVVRGENKATVYKYYGCSLTLDGEEFLVLEYRVDDKNILIWNDNVD